MDYHRDRFDDYSLILRSHEGKIAALLPAHRRESSFNSHSGLTYGGFAVGADMKLGRMLTAFAATIEYLQKSGFTNLLYKPVPYIYHTAPSEEDRYALHLCRAEWHLSSPTTVVARSGRLEYQNRRMRGVKKAIKNNVVVLESEDFATFWKIVELNLAGIHDSKPVHSADEMLFLKSRCPSNIRLFGAFEGDSMLAGVVVYESTRVAHLQYIASAARGRDIGALDLLLHTLLTEVFEDKPYFDFGTSSEGRAVNSGLIEQKEGFGARSVTQDWYRVDLTRVTPADIHAALV